MTRALRLTDQFTDDNGEPVVNGYLYIGESQQDPVTNPIAIYSDAEFSTPIANPQRTDSYGRPVNDIYIETDIYSYQLNDEAGAVIEGPKNRVSNTPGGFSPQISTATAGQTVINEPYNLGAMWLYINGSYIHESLYTAADGETITLNFPLQAGDNIVVINFTPRDINTALASNVTHTAQGRSTEVTLNNHHEIAKHIGDYGEIGGANASPAIQAMIDDVGYFVLPVGSFNIQDPLTIPATIGVADQAYGSVWRGQGMEKSVLVPVGMAGASAIVPASSTQIVRLSMRDFQIDGDCDSTIDITLTGAGQLTNTEFRNLILRSAAGSCFKATQHFSTAWYNVHTSSDSGHGFEIQGGNSTVLQNCYAHEIGANKAGYRIGSGAVLIGCNGVDEATNDIYWGWFGDTAGGLSYKVKIIGGNMEDFNLSGIALENFGSLNLENTQFVPRATGTYGSVIEALDGANHFVTIGEGVGVSSKGATLSGVDNILSAGAMFLRREAKSGTADLRTYAIGAQVYDGVTLFEEVTEFAKYGLRVNDFKATRDRSFRRPDQPQITANATTFDATGINCLRTNNSVATNLSTLTGLQDAQEMILLIKDANTTIKHNTGGAGRFILQSGADETPASGDVYKFIANSSVWQQV